jgi:hypothetical protein
MSVQFLSQLFKAFAVTAFPATQPLHASVPKRDKVRDGDSGSGRVLDVLYNIDMSCGEGLCLSEVFLSENRK